MKTIEEVREEANKYIQKNLELFNQEPTYSQVVGFVVKPILFDLEAAQLTIRTLEAKNKILETHFANLVRDCKWYADKGTEQERHHFLTCEAQGNYLDLAESEIAEAVGLVV